VIRLAWPLFSLPYQLAYSSTFTRFDGIVLGAVLAVHYRRQRHWSKLVACSRWLIPMVLTGMCVLTITTGSSSPTNYVGTALCIPMMNLVGMACVVLALEPASMLCRICSGSAICRFGRLSYGMYLFHYIYAPFVRENVFAWASHYMPRALARPLLALGALALTYGLAKLAYSFIEMPAMRMKNRLNYGPKTPRSTSRVRFAAPSPS
jgi:peptidoglycan/LPS O-acetylase OafA/YrhL